MNLFKLTALFLGSCTFFLLLGMSSVPPDLVDNAKNGKVTGGGTMISTSGDGKAVLAFNVDSCGGVVSGRFNFHDKNAGVKMLGKIVGADRCINISVSGGDSATRNNSSCEKSFYDSPRGCMEGYVISVDYRSTNPKDRGNGSAVACILDNGQGVVDAFGHGAAWFRVDSGPYAGYLNSNTIKGNAKSHACDE